MDCINVPEYQSTLIPPIAFKDINPNSSEKRSSLSFSFALLVDLGL
ncbi:hypothetical protein AVEN_207848-1, partial [Araneus ventricosus]